ncbi:S-layer homology domain-containing protein [Phormidium sp. LEGE 05292]|uniref:S-layer homology domain-containing protein n=1 Tax=[Phormidium] sp. LEGE 05292 TaxID=767427 RepID=UPI0018807461|nr:S-layer homology domain-containing protein [Phormidium sp. LEGE 05292]MBE9225564.1 S-layer homology domain-containing protein [Phormidium sp. LEGE 05292]
MTESQRPEPQPSKREPLGFDEFVAVLVALLSIGSIFFWSLSRKPINWNVTSTTPVQVAPTPRSSLLAPRIILPWLANRAVDRERRTVREGTNARTENRVVAVDPQRNGTQLGVVPEVAQPILPGVIAIAPSAAPEAIAPVPVPQAVETPAAPTDPIIPLQPKAVPVVPVPTKPTAKAPQPIKLSDVPANYWAAAYILGLQKQGVVSGFPAGYFRPDQPVTRAEFVAVIEKGLGSKITSKTVVFKDVSNSFWATPAIKKASGSEFIAGYPDQSFRPKQPIPRVQAIVALASGLNLPEPANPEQILKQQYKDAAQIPNYARKKVAAATQAGIVVNYPNTNVLNPNKNATRAEIAALVYQARVKQGKAQNVNGKYVVKP